MTEKKKTLAIIQARMSSSRLPGKVLKEIGGRPMLDQVVRRVRRAALIDMIAVATSDHRDDDPIEAFCARTGIDCYRGSLNDVLDRFHAAALFFKADIVVRLTADCPLLDPDVIDVVIRAFASEDYDYCSNVLAVTYPDGLDTEVFSLAALERAWREATLASEREHVTSYFRNHPERFRLKNVSHPEDLSSLRWTVDEPRDLAFVNSVFARLGDAPFGMRQVLELLGQERHLQDINAGIERNQGYQKSLREDRTVPEPGRPVSAGIKTARSR